ncbi:topoisomerase II-associated protein PAT1 [Scheffersomyces amazonensis]|uniref:topoisomerase II-associated protein PAT1 n=1 Tax=Scheffersomyces amazonensis TaxID=1078765 RepID=UPI00315DC9FF
MSFFGFDPAAPPSTRAQQEAYDFEETYDGLGEGLDEADDAFNTETFGSTGAIGKDFNFEASRGSGSGSGPSVRGSGVGTTATVPPQTISYAQAAAVAPAPANDDEFMQDLWGDNVPSKKAEGEKKILSLEEIEAQLTATTIDPSVQHHQLGVNAQYPPQPYGIPGMLPPPPPQYGGYMLPPGGYIPQQYGQFPGAPYQQFPPQGLPPQFQQPLPQGPVQLPPQVQQPTQPEVTQAQPQPQPEVQPQQVSQPVQPVQPVQAQIQPTEVKVPVARHEAAPRSADLSQFPVLGSKEAVQASHQHQAQVQAQAQGQYDNHHRGYDRNQQRGYHQHQHQHQYQHHQQQQADLTPEEQEKLARRQEKVARIMKYSGIMNPKDKDFVTRFQLSQIVTEDPYNEDFYAQVYKVIHPKVNNAGISASHQNNSIAQAYLDQSGHRLGGRYKRADVALQRMQQQVQRAVTVAKERPKLTQYAREGALGKISFGSGKKPRQQLEIISKAQQRKLEAEQNGQTSEGTNKKKYSNRDILSILENIITELMNIESESRTNSDVDTSNLWESLKVLEQSSFSGDDENEVNPFIQCLNFQKALKILPRLFKFLTTTQILTIVTLIISNLENLAVIKNGSYTTYETKRVPESIIKLVEAYSLTFSKVLMNAVLDFKFTDITGLLFILIEHNNVSFVSTTKIGLSILTTLLSRAELIIGEGSISATDLSEWSSCYDQLFQSLESRIAAIFPPHPEDVDDGSSRENYVWQFLATLSLGGKLSHQRIIVDEVRDEIFGVINRAKAIDNTDLVNLPKKQNLLNNLNMYLVVMGLVADENEIKELQT